MGETGEEVDKSKFSVKKIGTVKLTSKGTEKTQTKWELDCFDSEAKPSVNFTEKSDKNFEMAGQQFLEALDNVKFAATPKDHEHVLDSISMQVYEKELYFAATDMQHCAIYKIPAGVDIQSVKPLLISAVLLDHVSKVVNKEEKISVAYSEEKERVYIAQTNLRIRVASTEKQHISKFPSIELLLKKVYKPLTECSKGAMIGMLANASFINPNSALFVFLKENGTLTVKAMSEDAKLKPNIRQCVVGDISKDAKAIWGVTHLLNGLKVIKSNEIQLHIPDNMKSLKITAKDQANFIYFTMACENAIYNTSE
jgi:DNA polymerase III sliding clamp (beta) subunit (PCNA family)